MMHAGINIDQSTLLVGNMQVCDSNVCVVCVVDIIVVDVVNQCLVIVSPQSPPPLSLPLTL